MRRSPPMTPAMAAVIKFLLKTGRYHQHEIAAMLRINQGRVSEVFRGRRFRDVPPADDLPAGFALAA